MTIVSLIVYTNTLDWVLRSGKRNYKQCTYDMYTGVCVCVCAVCVCVLYNNNAGSPDIVACNTR